MESPEEKLSIDNFAGIKQLELEAQPFTVLIGPQSVGKSVTAKLLYFFRCIPRFLLEQADSDTPSSPDDIVIEKFKMFFPASVLPGKACTLTYLQGTVSIRLERAVAEAATWKIHLPRAVEDAFLTLRRRLSSSHRFDSTQTGAPSFESGARFCSQLI